MNAGNPGLAYRILSLLLLPLWCFHALWHGYSQGLPGYLRRRLLGQRKQPSDKAVIWVHASSVGEVMAVSSLVRALIKSGEAILFTSFTATGLQTIHREFPNNVDSDVIPIDCLPCCWYFLYRSPCKLCLLMETELWPELLYQVARHHVAIVQVNARLSAETVTAPVFVRYLLRRALSNISLHLTRSEQDRQRLIELGADPAHIKIIGNLKSAISGSEVHPNLIGRRYILFASSHEGEEVLLLKHRRKIDALIVIAPRHPGRSRAVQKTLSKTGICYAVRSKAQAIEADTQVYLADTLGELSALMAHAELVIMGGSFDQTGGHNLIEPASLGCPIITGPSDHNIIADIQQLGDSIFQADDMADCWRKIECWLHEPAVAQGMAKKASAIVRRQTGVLNAYLEEICALL